MALKGRQCTRLYRSLRDNPDTAMRTFHFALLRGPTRGLPEPTRCGTDVPKIRTKCSLRQPPPHTVLAVLTNYFALPSLGRIGGAE